MNNQIISIAPSRFSTKAVVASLAIFVGLLFWLVVATYPGFFLFNPLLEKDQFRAITLTLTTIGWVLISTTPTVILLSYAAGYSKPLSFLPFVALFWPVSLLVNHIVLYFQEGKWFIGYLLDYPIFLATDILLPALLIQIWLELRTVSKKRNLRAFIALVIKQWKEQ